MSLTKRILRKSAQKAKASFTTLCKRWSLLTPACRLARPMLKRIFERINRPSSIGLPYPSSRHGLDWIHTVLSLRAADYAEALPNEPGASTHSHRTICFYLPQFHPFAENDRWWGKGFTEWTNVSKATPQFIGHEQPRLPSDLGFYDLRLAQTLRSQAELASAHGIDGFCFYFYWFDGKPLMQAPLELWANTPRLEMPLCLCWANENWTRRWDGEEHEILIEQNHTPDDDLAFIDHIRPILKDPRYIRVDGKPLLLVYYPSLLPDPSATAQRWRDRVRAADGLELHLMCVHSKDQIDPRTIGFDGAVEFPPVGTHAEPYTDAIERLTPFQGGIYDYPATVEARLSQDRLPDYLLARGVMPGWDNTARRGIQASLFIGQTPDTYARWLHDAIRDMRWNHPPQQQLTFVNAWNEWAEGAYLEPDRRHGHAYLQATRKATSHWNAACGQVLAEGMRKHPQALVLHAYYEDVLPDIAGLVEKSGLKFDLWVSVVAPKVARTVLQLWPDAHVVHTPNLGRDVAPFLHLLPHIATHGYEAALKLHTKKSMHREDGDRWRQHLYGQLLPTGSGSANLLQGLYDNDQLGLIAPDGHLPALRHFWGKNRHWLNRLTRRYGLPQPTGKETFAAGTMFWFKPQALHQLLDDPLHCGDFWHDIPSQIDGSLAHAMERFFALLAAHNGYQVSEVSPLLGKVTTYGPDHWSGLLGDGDLDASS